MNSEQRAIARIIASCWADEAFKRRFLANPDAVLRDFGVRLPPNVTFRVHESSETERDIVLPPLPPGLRPDQVPSHDFVPLMTWYGGPTRPRSVGGKRRARKGAKRGAKKTKRTAKKAR